jgi:UDP-N-acetylmuramoyl-L-alanyl-D-glutamate--2,6-diaminopimelate ligase
VSLGAVPGRHAEPRGATLAELVRELPGAAVSGDAGCRVRDVRHDSRDVLPGDVFVVRRGARDDGARYIPEALRRGAAALVSTVALEASVPVAVVPDVERALAWMSSHVWGHPTWTLDIVGVTGTNGKTTTTWLLEHCLTALGDPPGLVGTVAQRYRDLQWPALHTTPEADDLARRFAAMLAAGADTAVMEVSSHALALQRVGAVRFRAAGLTNVTQDHLDFHGTQEAYVAAKRSLFEAAAPAVSVLNLDDAVGRALFDTVPGALGFSASGDAAAQLRVLSGGPHARGIDALLHTPEGPVALRSPLRGAHNIENLLCALGLAASLGHPYARAAEALETALGAPGRLELVTPAEGSTDLDVLVDYAHSRRRAGPGAHDPARGVTPRGACWCVFGCGGDRDVAPSARRWARPSDARRRARRSLHRQPPRANDPDDIIARRRGSRWPASDAWARRRPARQPPSAATTSRATGRAAIALAVSLAKPGDTVLIAGKGHETYQEVCGVRTDFDDRVEARAALASRRPPSGSDDPRRASGA